MRLVNYLFQFPFHGRLLFASVRVPLVSAYMYTYNSETMGAINLKVAVLRYAVIAHERFYFTRNSREALRFLRARPQLVTISGLASSHISNTSPRSVLIITSGGRDLFVITTS